MVILPALLSGVGQTLGAEHRVGKSVWSMRTEQAVEKGKKPSLAARIRHKWGWGQQDRCMPAERVSGGFSQSLHRLVSKQETSICGPG